MMESQQAADLSLGGARRRRGEISVGWRRLIDTTCTCAPAPLTATMSLDEPLAVQDM